MHMVVALLMTARVLDESHTPRNTDAPMRGCFLLHGRTEISTLWLERLAHGSQNLRLSGVSYALDSPTPIAQTQKFNSGCQLSMRASLGPNFFSVQPSVSCRLPNF
jgi:hypothetical protein